MRLCLFEMHIKAVHGYIQLCVKFVNNATKRLTLKYFVIKQIWSNTPRDENILPRTVFTQKTNDEFFPNYVISYSTISSTQKSGNRKWK